MSLRKTVVSAFVLALAAGVAPAAVLAQTAPPAAPAAPASGAKLVLLPYESPGSTDPHAAAITQTLSADLAAAGVAVATVAPVDHLEAVASAAKICTDNNATGILVPEGRYEQTKRSSRRRS